MCVSSTTYIEAGEAPTLARREMKLSEMFDVVVSRHLQLEKDETSIAFGAAE